MEGKAVLFKKFANIDCFDIEVNEKDPEKLAEIVAEPRADLRGDQPRGHQGARLLRRRAALPRADEHPGLPRRPARHGDRRRRRGDERAQGGGQGVRGGQDRLDRRRGGGHRLPQHAAEARGEARERLALRHPRPRLCRPRRGHEPREGGLRPEERAPHARPGDRRRRPLPRALGAGRADRRRWCGRWRANPIIFALANPNPEIDPAVARAANPDAIIATGRSDYPNQVNNVLCFPFIFRGALDVGATEINDAMQIACVEGIAALARASSSAEAAAAYQGERLSFGRDYLIPKAFDPRLLAIVAGAVAQAAMETGVALRPVPDIEAYKASAQPVGLPLGLHHAPGLRCGAQRRPAHRLRRGRGRAGAARRLRDDRGAGGQADPHRAPGRDRGALRAGGDPPEGRA